MPRATGAATRREGKTEVSRRHSRSADRTDRGVASQRVMGTPQGGPFTPLLSNILLDDLDKEFERRGHAFCRCADDCNIRMRTRRSGKRVMASVSRFLTERLKLRVNEAKSAVGRP